MFCSKNSPCARPAESSFVPDIIGDGDDAVLFLRRLSNEFNEYFMSEYEIINNLSWFGLKRTGKIKNKLSVRNLYEYMIENRIDKQILNLENLIAESQKYHDVNSISAESFITDFAGHGNNALNFFDHLELVFGVTFEQLEFGKYFLTEEEQVLLSPFWKSVKQKHRKMKCMTVMDLFCFMQLHQL
jgi:hypothetical protein